MFSSLTKIFFLCFFISQAIANEIPIDVNQPHAGHSLEGSASYLEDESKTLIFPKDILVHDGWLPLNRHNTQIGLSSSDYWLKFKLVNSSNSKKSIYLVHELAFLDVMEIYSRNSDGFQVQKVSGIKPYGTRLVDMPLPSVKLTMHAGESITVFAKFSNQHIEHNSLNLSLWSDEKLAVFKNKYIFTIAFFTGLALTLGVIWMVFAVVLKQARFAAYSIFMSLAGVYYLAYSGVGFQLLYPMHPEIHNRLFLITLQGALTFTFLFARLHLEPQKWGLLWIDKALKWFFVIGLFLTFNAIFRLSDMLAVIGAMTYSGLMLFNGLIGVIVWSRCREDFAFWFMIGWISTGISMFFLMLFYTSGIGNQLFTTGIAHLLGQVFLIVEGLTLSISLARWFQREQKQKAVAEFSAMTDPLTGLLNRRALTKETQKLTKMANIDYWLAVLDIDHFKSINDTYGHPAGDSVIKQLADIFRQCIRQQDMAFRVGGEEFVIIIRDSEKQVAVNIVNRVRTIFEHTPILCDGKTINHTLSAGLTNNKWESNVLFETTFKVADKALFEAKCNGRNRVVVV